MATLTLGGIPRAIPKLGDDRAQITAACEEYLVPKEIIDHIIVTSDLTTLRDVVAAFSTGDKMKEETKDFVHAAGIRDKALKHCSRLRQVIDVFRKTVEETDAQLAAVPERDLDTPLEPHHKEEIEEKFFRKIPHEVSSSHHAVGCLGSPIGS